MIDWEEIEEEVYRAARRALLSETIDEHREQLPKALLRRIGNWKFGGYGWTSPVNLMITACWTKWLLPSQDVCKIWAKNTANKLIPGGYSIRSYDERITVPLVSRLSIYHQFCSNNSGMQGTRAIEKTRSASRIERNMRLEQRVYFDLSLFAEIMNDINDLNPGQAKIAFQHFIAIGSKISKQRKLGLESLLAKNVNNQNDCVSVIHKALAEIGDPQFTVIVTAMCMKALAEHSTTLKGAKLKGIDGKKTGANARSNVPGDLWLEVDSLPVVACEVKDRSKTFGYEILSAVEDRYIKNPTLEKYLMVTGANIAIENRVLVSAEWTEKIAELNNQGLGVQVLTIRELIGFLSLLGPVDQTYIIGINTYLSKFADLKADTVAKWSNIIKQV
jgi:hypothetical protein